VGARCFLVVTLFILGFAVVSFRYVDQATRWAWGPTLLWVAGVVLAIAPTCVVLLAACSSPMIYAATLTRGLDGDSHDRLTTTEIYLNLFPEDVVREFREK
jgi:hypothetical protein